MCKNIKATENYSIGDSILFSGSENLLHFDPNTGQLINVYFDLGTNKDSSFGLIIDIKEHPEYGGELEIYASGEVLTLPWHPGKKPQLFVIGE